MVFLKLIILFVGDNISLRCAGFLIKVIVSFIFYVLLIDHTYAKGKKNVIPLPLPMKNKIKILNCTTVISTFEIVTLMLTVE